jgi:hypothetical protein
VRERVLGRDHDQAVAFCDVEHGLDVRCQRATADLAAAVQPVDRAAHGVASGRENGQGQGGLPSAGDRMLGDVKCAAASRHLCRQPVASGRDKGGDALIAGPLVGPGLDERQNLRVPCG